MTEIWKKIPNLPGYEASNLGSIKGPRCIRKLQLRPDGYLHITLVKPKSGTRINLLVNRLVCMAFHEDTWFEGAYALHKDHVKTNNCEDNLYWGTHQDNMDDKVKASRSYRPSGNLNPKAKLTWTKVRELRHLAEAGYKPKDLATQFGIDYTTCNKIINNKHWIESN